MNIEELFFQKNVINEEKLIEFGFQKKDNLYLYKTNINNTFEVTITYKKNIINGVLIDRLTGEEYLGYRKNVLGSYSQKIYDEYLKILEKIKKYCCSEEYFKSAQANRMTKMIKANFNCEPQFLFASSPDTAVFKHKTGKWFGIIMNINLNKISTKDKEVDILNVKIDPQKILKLLEQPGFYQAYHMNKKYWVTISLDDTTSDEIIFGLIKESIKNTT